MGDHDGLESVITIGWNTHISREIIAMGVALACPRYSTRYLPDEQPEALAAQPRASYCVRG